MSDVEATVGDVAFEGVAEEAVVPPLLGVLPPAEEYVVVGWVIVMPGFDKLCAVKVCPVLGLVYEPIAPLLSAAAIHPGT